MKKNLLSSPALTLGLAFLVPIFFVFSKNSHMVSVEGLLLSSGIALLIACLAIVGLSLCIWFYEKKSANFPMWMRWLVMAIFCMVIVETCCFFLQGQLFAAIPEPRWLRILVSRMIPFIILFLLVYKFGFRPINVFLCIFWGISVINLGIALSESDPLRPDISLLSYEIKQRPNIYLFVQESYHPLDIQREVYGIDTSYMEAYLARNGFTDYGKIYANSPHTLGSFADLFSFRPSWVYARGNNDVRASVRPMLGGNKFNTLFRIMKANDYNTVWIVGDSGYYGTIRGEYLDDSDGLIGGQSQSLIFDVITCFEMLNTRFRDASILSLRKYYEPFFPEERAYTGNLENRVSQAIARHNQPGSPLFLIFKGGANHTPSDGSYSWEQNEEWVQSGRYQKLVEKGNLELQRICDLIIAKDPGALIILIGDHGSWRFQGADKGWRSSLKDIVCIVEEKGISWSDFCEDRFAAFLAIRLPYGLQADISHGQVMSHVNLFRHIFAYLNQDESILEAREPSNTYFRGQTVIVDGKVVSEP